MAEGKSNRAITPNVPALTSGVGSDGRFSGDLNDLTSTCAVAVVGATNRPSGVSGTDVHLLITIASEAVPFGWGSYPIVMQFYLINGSSAAPYFRYKYTGSWYNWRQL